MGLTEPTFRHLLQQAEDGTGLDEVSGLEEVHGGRKVRLHHLLLFHFQQQRVQPLLGISQHHLPTCLHGGLQLYEGLSLSRVGYGQATGQALQEEEQAGHSRPGALELDHGPREKVKS